MNYEDTLLDFVQRTRENLALTQKWRAADTAADFHEVTHLVNSLLGLIVLPKERVLNDMEQVPVAPAGIPAWGVEFQLIQRGGSLPEQLRPFVTGLRNAIAHASLEFAADGPDISGIRFLNRTTDKTRRVLWEASFEIDGLREFLHQMTHEVERACRRRSSMRSGSGRL